MQSWRAYTLRRRLKQRRLDICMHKYLLEKSGDLARLLISTLDLRKSQRMHHLLTLQRERMEIFQKFFRLWRDLAN